MNYSKIQSGKSLDDVHSSVDTTKKIGIAKSMFAFMGPAYLVSVGYMDPGNWATDIAGGSAFGYNLIWVLLMSNLIAILLQSHCVKLGIVRGRDLAQASKEAFPSIVNIPLWILAEIAIAATDLAEVIGFALGLNLLFHIPMLLGVSIAVFDSLLLLLLIQLGIRKMEAFIIVLVLIICSCFFFEIFIAKPDVAEIAMGFIPSIPNETALYIAIGIIGATVMPHNLYLHSALVQTRKIEQTEKGKRRAIRFNIFDSVIALNLAFLVNASILILAGAVFFTHGYHQITEMQDAHGLLAPLLGNTLAPILFAIALIASGQCSTITGTLSGQIVMEGYLNLRITPWLRRLMTRTIAVIPAFLVIWINGEGATGELLILSQVVLSLQLGFAVIPLIHFVSDKKKMGAFAISTWLKIASWLSAIIIIALNGKLVLSFLINLISTAGSYQWLVYTTILPLVILAIALLLYITLHPLISKPSNNLTGLHKASLPMEFEVKDEFRKIAIAVDFSAKDQLTISHALTAGGHKAIYFLIHVVESAGALMMEKEIHDLESQDDLNQLKRYAAALEEKGYMVDYELGFGKPTTEIPKFVAKKNADLLVMGAHGHRGLKDMIFGESINAVRHSIKIPLLAVK
ncbi:MAG: Nramp family divalent metal transporter [Chitinophagales bacterium]|nr:Nramp family divalent metal transporter [Chitinophagales bacterium]